MSNKKKSMNELKDELFTLKEKQLQETAKQMGWDLKALEKLGVSHQKELQDLQTRWGKAVHKTMPNPDETLKAVIPNARLFTRSRNVVFYQPDPFGPSDVQTDGPFLDPQVPPVTMAVCRVEQTTILDTSANQGVGIDYLEGSDQIASESSSFDATAGVNSVQFNFVAAGKDLSSQHYIEFKAGFRFNFFPPDDGQYIVRPTAFLAGSWNIGGASSLPFHGDASMSIAFRTRVSQFAAEPPTLYAYHDVVLVDEASSKSDLNGVFKFQTPSSGETASVSVDLVKDLRAHIVVSCVARVRLGGFGNVMLNAQEPKFGLRVPEVHVDMLDCSGRISLDNHFFMGREERRGPLPNTGNVPGVL